MIVYRYCTEAANNRGFTHLNTKFSSTLDSKVCPKTNCKIRSLRAQDKTRWFSHKASVSHTQASAQRRGFPWHAFACTEVFRAFQSLPSQLMSWSHEFTNVFQPRLQALWHACLARHADCSGARFARFFLRRSAWSSCRCCFPNRRFCTLLFAPWRSDLEPIVR